MDGSYLWFSSSEVYRDSASRRTDFEVKFRVLESAQGSLVVTSKKKMNWQPRAGVPVKTRGPGAEHQLRDACGSKGGWRRNTMTLTSDTGRGVLRPCPGEGRHFRTASLGPRGFAGRPVPAALVAGKPQPLQTNKVMAVTRVEPWTPEPGLQPSPAF